MKTSYQILNDLGACNDALDDDYLPLLGVDEYDIEWNLAAQMLLLPTPMKKHWGYAVYKGWIPAWSMSGANLRRADLSGADLRRADLWRADLRRADLAGADLRGADLRVANLWRADLRRANLAGANLEGANLRRANLEGANLENTILEK